MVAREAGVAQSTVSLVVNNKTRVSDDTRKRVIAAARKLGYIPEPQSRRNLIGIIISSYRVMNSYQAMTLTALKEEIHRRGWRMEIINNNDVELLNDRVVCGAVSISGDHALNERWRSLKSIPLVRFASESSHIDNIYSVYSDFRTNLKLIFRHLRGKGHRRIGLILGRTEEQEAHLLVKTGIVFREILAMDGFLEPDAFVSYADEFPLRKRLEALLSRNITALTVIPGDTALEVGKELSRLRIRIPEDLSLITREYSNVSEYLTPPMTTLLPDYPAMASAALDLLDRLLKHETPPGDIACPGRLILRDSVKDIRKKAAGPYPGLPTI